MKETRYEDLCDEGLLFRCILECRKKVHWKRSVQSYSLYAVANAARLARMMRSERWEFAPCRRLTIRERGKARMTEAVGMDERVIQKALRCEALSPALQRQMIYDSGATIKGRGVAFTRRRVVRHLCDYYSRFGNGGYILQIDIKGYFEGIDHEVLLSKLKPLIKDGRIMKLVSFLMERNGKGLSLGSEANQILAAWFLSEIDHWCKEVFKIRHYGRYMDDIYMIHPSRLYLAECLEKTTVMLSRLGLSANERKTRITPLGSGFSFLKVRYTLSESGRIGRKYGKESGRRMRRRIRKFAEKKLPGTAVRNEYQSWRRAVKKFDADGPVRACDAAYRKYILGGKR